MTPQSQDYDLISEQSTCGPRYNEDEAAAFVHSAGRSAESSAKVWSHCSATARASARTNWACSMIF
jgi:hypothetical protein